jgi:asparagine synthase (glutamine-hydrolysing)
MLQQHVKQLLATISGIQGPTTGGNFGLTRQSKDDGSIDVDYGIRRHSDELVALWEDSRLERLGLVDAGRLRELCAEPSSLELEDGALFSTIGCELWLRDLELDFVNP